MPPATSRDFLKVALQRLTVAEAVCEILGFNLDAQYLGGYAVECSLKALILEKTPSAERPEMLKKISSGAPMHRPEVLLGKLKEYSVTLTADLARKMRRFDWTTDLRYEVGRRDTGETRALLRTAKAVYDWVEEQIP
jgi:hypothetical protein